MKLSEIYQAPDDTWDDEGDNGTYMSKLAKQQVIDQRQGKNHRYMGSGGNAYVGTDDDDNFGDVKRTADASDGGSLYLKYIAEHPELMDNPFFPKVRKIEHYDYDDNAQVTVVERLLPLDTEGIWNNSRLMRAVWSRLFVESWDDEIASNLTEWLTGEIYQAAIYGPGNTKNIKDPTLFKAIAAVIKIKEYVKGEFDMHNGNFMWRPHPYQPQLVFVDPIVT